jgi:cell wall-associated NlpC family hydrolase
VEKHLFLLIFFTFIEDMFRLSVLLATICSGILLSCGSSKKTVQPASSGDILITSTEVHFVGTGANRAYDSIQVKYAVYLHTTPEQVQNLRLYRFIDKWLYTPYKWGGDDKQGIDCSAFMKRLLSEVYQIQIPRTSIQQFFDGWIERYKSDRYLSEGDLVFFQTIGENAVSHVGLYLGNHMFVNASSSKGVCIASLEDPYWKPKFVAAGRIKRQLATN